jgi:glutathione S-transferase
VKSEFLCGEDYSIGDIQFYNEILTVLTLLKRDISTRDFPNLSNWYYKISKVPEVVEVEKKFKEIVVKYSFI